MKVARIHLMDGAVKALPAMPADTVEALEAKLASKLDLVETSFFSLFEKRGGWERALEPDENILNIQASWEAEADSKDAPVFLFKKKIFIQEDAREMVDPAARQLVYIQAVANVINDVYPCTPEDAVRLAGLHVQFTYGDHNPATHVAGFLESANLKNFMPHSMLDARKPAEWEASIFKAHKGHAGKDKDTAMTKYLDIVKHFPYYGTTFFPPCKSAGNGRKVPSSVIIGVNSEGLLLLKAKAKDVVSSHPYTEICSWSSSASTFSFEFGASQYEATKYTFETNHGAIIASTIQTYIDILVELLTAGDQDDDDMSSTATGSVDGSDDV